MRLCVCVESDAIVRTATGHIAAGCRRVIVVILLRLLVVLGEGSGIVVGTHRAIGQCWNVRYRVDLIFAVALRQISGLNDAGAIQRI